MTPPMSLAKAKLKPKNTQRIVVHPAEKKFCISIVTAFFLFTIPP